MNTICKSVYVAFLILNVCVTLLGQEKASTNEWRGLELGTATPGLAIEKLGTANSDKTEQRYRPVKFNEWFDVEKKDFRVLHYEGKKGVAGFEDVKLFFRNDVLVAIRLEPDKLKAHQLTLAYDSEFMYLSDKFAESLHPADFERNRGRSFPKSFPEVYYLMNKTESAYAFAMVANNSFGSILGKAVGVKDASESLPGNVSILELIWVKLESTKGSDLLK